MHKIDFSGQRFDAERLMNELMSAGTSLVSINVKESKMRWSDAKAFADILDANPLCTVLELDISHNMIGPEGAAALCSSTTLFRALQILNISFCKIENDGAASLGSIIRECQTLTHLYMAGNSIGQYGIGAFARRGLDGNSGLLHLDLDSNEIERESGEGFDVFCSCLQLHDSIMHLSLRDNKLNSTCARALCEMFPVEEEKKKTAVVLESLKTLKLGKNPLQKDGAGHIGEMLKRNKFLTELDLSDTALGGSKLDAVLILATNSDGVSSVASSLQFNSTLTSLDLSGNRIGKSDIKQLADALPKNKSLSRLMFDDTDHVELIEKGVKGNNSITFMGSCTLPPTIEGYVARNKKHREAFVKAVTSGQPIAKLEPFFEKGVDIAGPDAVKGVVELISHASDATLQFLLSKQVFRGIMFSSVKFLDQVPSLPPRVITVLAKSQERETVLFFACRVGHPMAAELMIKAGANMERKDVVGRTALLVACEHGHENIVETLLDKGADHMAQVAGLSCLILAIRTGHLNVCRMLINKRPELLNVCTPAPKARGPLHMAARFGRCDIIEFLLEKGIDVNVSSGDNRRPLHVVTTPEACKLLIAAGADVKRRPDEPRDVLSCALFPDPPARKPYLDVATVLIENHAEKKDIFEQIRDLDLSDCFRDTIPLWVGQLPNLNSLNLQGNLLRSMPRNVADPLTAQRSYAVVQYLKDFSSGSKDVWQGFKIMVLGKEGVGKTHIFHLAAGKTYPRNASTDGIDIHNFLLGEARVPVTWFDFGGQEVFYPTHELFLTGQCVYLIAFKMDDPNFDVRVSYWLRVVNSFAQDKAKVVIIGTHKDKIMDRPGRLQAVQTKIDEMTADSLVVVEKFYISCIDDPKLMGDLISNALLAAAQQARLGSKEVPHIYNVIKDWAADQRKRDKVRPYFNWDAFVECFPGYDSYLLERACEFLHDMGVLFLAKRFSGNKKANIVCIDVQWLAKAFSTILTFKHNWVKEGVLRQEALSHIWRDFGIVDNGEITAIMSLFEKFNIAFARREDGVWIVPSMLPDLPPTSLVDLDSLKVTHARKYKLEVVPSGAFGQVLARVSEWSDVLVTEMWRFGIVLRDQEQRAVLTVENGSELLLRITEATRMTSAEKKMVKPSVEGAGTLLRRLDEELQLIFRTLFRRMVTFPVTTFILCPHCVDAAVPSDSCNWLPYDDVIRNVLSGQRHFSCGEVLRAGRLERLGEDLTLGYVKTFESQDVTIEKEALARGGFGQIFKGVMKKDTKIVVKELILSGETEISLFSDFQREVSLMAQLKHENLVRLFGIMVSPLRMVLEFCGEGDLLGALRKGKLGDDQLRMRIAVDVAHGMSFLHALVPPLAHRDLRSPNVLLMSLKHNSKEPVAKVADFGLTAAASNRLQQELLTWQWMAPEAFLGENYTETCDLYSYGIVLWEIFKGTGEIPFEAIAAAEKSKKKQARDFMNDIIHKGVRPQIEDTFPESVKKVLPMLWEKDPNARPKFPVVIELLLNRQVDKRKRFAWRNKQDVGESAALRVRIVSKHLNTPVSDVRCVAVQPSVKGNPGLLWLGGAAASVTAVDKDMKVTAKSKRMHTQRAAVILCNVVDGSVWTGGTEGNVVRWELGVGNENVFDAAAQAATPVTPVAQEPPRKSPQLSRIGSGSKAPEGSGGGRGWSRVVETSKTPQPSGTAVLGSRRQRTDDDNVESSSPGPRQPSPRPSSQPSPRPSTPSSGGEGTTTSTPTVRGSIKTTTPTSIPRTGSGSSLDSMLSSIKSTSQPHIGSEVTCLILAQKGLVISGDAAGVVAVWDRSGEPVFETQVTEQVRSMCTDGKSLVWIAEGNSLHRAEMSSKGAVEVVHSMDTQSRDGFSSIVLVGDSTIWGASGATVKMVDITTDSIVKVVKIPVLRPINSLSLVRIHGQETLWSCGEGQVCIWDIKTKTPIKTHTDLTGSVIGAFENGENTAIVVVRNGSSVDLPLDVFKFDLHQ